MSGWAMRTRTMESGGRQVLNFLLPGDLIGLQSAVLGSMQHSVEALTPVVVCALPMRIINKTGMHQIVGQKAVSIFTA